MVSAKNYSSGQRTYQSSIGEGDKGYNKTSEFVDRIIQYSRLQRGRNYRELAEYLQPQILQRRNPQLSQEDEKGRLQGTIQIYTPYTRVLRNELESTEQVSVELRQAQDVGGKGLLILLCGVPSPSLLSGLGSVCRLDPEFLRRHFAKRWEERPLSSYGEFNTHSPPLQPLSLPPDLTLPSLPSTSQSIIQLRYTSIGFDIYNGPEKYLELLNNYGSIVREVRSIGGRYFAVEQQISMCVEHFPSKHDRNDSWLGKWTNSQKMPAFYLAYGFERLHMDRQWSSTHRNTFQQ